MTECVHEILFISTLTAFSPFDPNVFHLLYNQQQWLDLHHRAGSTLQLLADRVINKDDHSRAILGLHLLPQCLECLLSCERQTGLLFLETPQEAIDT